MGQTLLLAVIWGLSLLFTACEGVDPTCIDHLSFGLACQDMTGFCEKPEAKVICPKYCGLCDYGCDFESQTFCSWTNENNAVTLDWILGSAARGNENRGYYIMTSTDPHAVIPEAVLRSERLPHGSHYCLKFWYHFGSGSSGEVFVQREVSGVRAEVLAVVNAEDTRRDHWHQLSVEVEPYIVDYSLLIVADTDSLSSAPIAVDDVTLTQGTCSLPTTTTTTTTTTTPPATTTHRPHCPHNWELFQRSCYRADPQAVTASEAKEKCERQGAHLVEVESAEETTFLINYAHSHNIDELWLGIEKIAFEGTWVYVSNHQEPAYSNWNGGQPPSPGSTEYCARFVTHDSGHWQDRDCEHHYATVCKKPAS